MRLPTATQESAVQRGTITDRQLDLILRLATERPGVKTYVDTQLATYRDANGERFVHPSQLSKSEASNVIGVVLDDLRHGVYSTARGFADRKPAPDRKVETGMYKDGDEIYRVYYGQQSGRNLVARLVEAVGDPKRDYRFQYVGLAARKLPPDAAPLPLEEAKAWGKMTGTCCVCARRLDVPESVDAGIGPKCARRFQ